jgi:hypothetical protein
LSKMKISKKIRVGLCVLLCLVGAFTLLGAKKTYAASMDAETFAQYPYTVTAFDASGNISALKVTIGGKDYFFNDADPTDDTLNLKYYGSAGPICHQTQDQDKPMAGITIDSGPFQALAADKGYFNAHISVGYSGDTNVDCDENGAQEHFDEDGDRPDITILFAKNMPHAPTVTAAPTNGGGTGSTGGSGSTSSGNSCEALTNNGFEWAFCGILRGIDDFMNSINNYIESQLNLNVNELLNQNVQQAWNVFRILASSLLVLIMLIMVFSQAISAGPFDAYTVRKLLPKLVAAVILIQISFYITKYAVVVANDLGNGLAQLISLPFGGTEKLSLPNLLEQAGPAQATAAVATSLVAVVVATAITPFGAVLAGLFIVLGILTATAALLVRQAIIIAAAIFLPLAFVAWLLPGTQKYWKLLWDNFIKALLLFPIIVGLIYIGRIFAWIVSSGATSAPGPIGVIAIVLGFFGPYFLLPKAFSWGGSMMKMANNGITSGVNKVAGERGKKFLQQRGEELSAERTRRSQERYQRNERFNPLLPWRRPIDLVKSGQVDPTRWGRRRNEAMSRYRAGGVESEEKEIKIADQDFSQLAAQSENHDDFARMVGGAKIGDTVRWTDRFGKNQKMKVTKAMKQAGMNGMQKYGTDQTYRELSRIMNELNHGSAEEQILAERFRDANVGTLKPKMDYLYRGASKVKGGSDFVPDWDGKELKGPVHSRVGALTAESFATMEAPDLEAMLAGLSEVANNHPDTAAKAAAVEDLQTIYRNYQAALDNDQVRRAMGPSLNQSMKAHLDGTGLADINQKRKDARLTLELRPVAALAGAGAGIAARINNDGSTLPASAVTAVPAPAGGTVVTAAAPAAGGGAVVAPATGGGGAVGGGTVVTPSAGELRIEHTANAQVQLPSVAGLNDKSQLESYFIRLKSDPSVRQTLAQGLAYNVFGGGPAGDIQRQAHENAIAQFRIEAERSGSEEDKAAFNSLINEIQQANFQRADEIVRRQSAGLSPAEIDQRRTQIHATIAPEITRLESMKF